MNNERPVIGRIPLQIGLIVLALMFAIAAWAWFQIPAGEQIPVHWGPSGTPDRYGGKFEGLLLLPLITAGTAVLLAVIPRFEPRQRNISLSGRVYGAFFIIMMLFMLGVQLMTMASIFGYVVNTNMYIAIALGALFIAIGNFMGKIRSNFFFGIRTPWTLASDLAWDKTHRLGGKLMMGMGILVLLSGVLSSSPLFIWILLGGNVLLLVVLMAYSYRVWRDDPAVERM